MNSALTFSYLAHGGRFFTPIRCQSLGLDALNMDKSLFFPAFAQPTFLGASQLAGLSGAGQLGACDWPLQRVKRAPTALKHSKAAVDGNDAQNRLSGVCICHPFLGDGKLQAKALGAQAGHQRSVAVHSRIGAAPHSMLLGCAALIHCEGVDGQWHVSTGQRPEVEGLALELEAQNRGVDAIDQVKPSRRIVEALSLFRLRYWPIKYQASVLAQVVGQLFDDKNRAWGFTLSVKQT